MTMSDKPRSRSRIRTAARNEELVPLLDSQGTFPSAINADSREAKELMRIATERRLQRGSKQAIAVSLVSQGMLDFAYNWICSARRFHFTNYIILASDQGSYQSLKAAQVPVVYMVDHTFGDSQFLRYGTSAYQALMHLRLLYVKHLLEHGYRVLLFDVDQVWTANPFDFIDMNCDADLHTQDDGMNKPQVCLGFVYLNPTPRLLQLWEDVRIEHSARTRERAPSERHTEQRIFNDFSSKANLTRHFLNRELFIHGGLYWNPRVTLNYVSPVQIHDNWIVGRENKLKRLEESSLWMIKAGYDWNTTAPAQCDYTHTQLANVVSPPPRLHEMEIVIKVLPSSPISSLLELKRTEERLDALVDAMLRADYSSASVHQKEKGIVVELHQTSLTATTNDGQAAPVALSSSVSAMYSRVLRRLKLQWGMGEVRLIDTEQSVRGREPLYPMGIEQWLGTWKADSDNEAAIMIDDQQTVSPQWWRWVRYAVGAHHCSLDGFDPRLFGVVLERNHQVIATQGLMDHVLPPSNKTQGPFVFQNVGYHATLFFPRPWRHFRDWVAKRNQASPPELAAFNYSRVHALAAGAPATPADGRLLKTRWYTWWLAFTADIGLAALHPPVVGKPFVRSQLTPQPGEEDTPFLPDKESLLVPIGDAHSYRAMDFRGLSWRSTLHLAGLLNTTTTLFNVPVAEGKSVPFLYAN